MIQSTEHDRPSVIGRHAAEVLDNDAGLTLIELLLVATLLVLMASILYGSLTGLIRTRNEIDSRRNVSRTGRYVIQRISSDLLNRGEEPLTKTGTKNNSGTSGASSLYAGSTFLIGKNRKSGGAPASSIRFVSTTGAQAIIGGDGNYGRVEVEYRLESNRPGAANGEKNFVLMREETPAGITDKTLIDQQRIVFPIAENVTALRFRYWSQGKWLTEWAANQSRLPDAVEISVGIAASSGESKTFKTAVTLNYENTRHRTP